MAKATHRGHCQACGRLQLLPGGSMSLHGYTVAHGYFSGTCAGSKHLPFEASHRLIDGFIVAAKNGLESLERRQAELRQPATAATCMVHAYLGSAKDRSGYAWREVELIAVPMPHDPTLFNYEYEITRWDGSTRRSSIGDYSYPRLTLLETATKQNRQYADWLEHEAVSLRRYIAWQTERVANWQPAPLLPLEHRDKLGFEPTPAKY